MNSFNSIGLTEDASPPECFSKHVFEDETLWPEQSFSSSRFPSFEPRFDILKIRMSYLGSLRVSRNPRQNRTQCCLQIAATSNFNLCFLVQAIGHGNSP